MNSNTLVRAYHPMSLAIEMTRPFLDNGAWWNHGTKEQMFFLREIFPAAIKEVNNVPELAATASTEVQEINQWLISQGFTLQLREDVPCDFATAATMKIALTWRRAGGEYHIVGQESGSYYKGVVFKSGNPTLQLFQTDNGKEIVQLTAQNGDVVTMFEGVAPENEQTLIFQALAPLKLNPLRQNRWGKIEGAVVPKLYFDKIEDHVVQGVRTNDGDYLNQAIQQTRFSLDENGAIVEAAAAAGGERSIDEPNYVFINKSCYVVVTRPGLTVPLLAGYFDQQDTWETY